MLYKFTWNTYLLSKIHLQHVIDCNLDKYADYGIIAVEKN